MTRVSVIGNAGGGKSRLSAAICLRHNLPNYSIDHLQWQPGWVPTPQAKFKTDHQAILSKDCWLVDGYGPWESVVERLEASDIIIFVDLPIWVHYWWATKRQVKSLFVGRSDGPDGCPMPPVTLRLFKMMWHVHKNMRPKLQQEIARLGRTKRVIHLQNVRQLNRFAAQPV